MSSNPYSAPLQPQKQDIGTGGPAAHPMSPLYNSAGWITFLGWVMIIQGILACLTIIGIVFGWLPIWMGILLKGAGEKLKSGFATSNNGELYESSRSLANYFTIMAILTIIGLAFWLLYMLFIIMMILGSGFAFMQ